jgi:hypothetical protein
MLLAGVASYLLRLATVLLLGKLRTAAWLNPAGRLITPVNFSAMAVARIAGHQRRREGAGRAALWVTTAIVS